MSIEHTMLRWVEQLQSRGRYTFTRAEAQEQTSRSLVAAQSALRRLRQQGRLASPRRGFYVIVPPEYRAAGSPPASWFIDDVMRLVGRPYYVGILSAAALHGAAHQQPQVFQVVTEVPMRTMSAGRVSVHFFMCGNVEMMPVTMRQTQTGQMRIATPETTAFDLVRYPKAAGHLSNAATVLTDLHERIDPGKLADVAQFVRLPDVQRLGYLLDLVGASDAAGTLHQWLRGRHPRVVPLRSGTRVRAAIDARWHVLPNEKVEIDL